MNIVSDDVLDMIHGIERKARSPSSRVRVVLPSPSRWTRRCPVRCVFGAAARCVVRVMSGRRTRTGHRGRVTKTCFFFPPRGENPSAGRCEDRIRPIDIAEKTNRTENGLWISVRYVRDTSPRDTLMRLRRTLHFDILSDAAIQKVLRFVYSF